jgi:signal transduction histidine kinase
MKHNKTERNSLPAVSSGAETAGSRRFTLLAHLIMLMASIPWVRLFRRMISFSWQLFSSILTALSAQRPQRGRGERESRLTVAARPSLAEQIERVQDRELQINFLEMASHELKTPMTTILGQAQLLLRRLSRMPELSSEMTAMRTALESIDSQTRRLSRLVDDLLDLYNIRAGKIQLRLSMFDMVEMCAKVVEEQSLLSGRTIDVDVRERPILLYGDSDRLGQVLINLISNALAYSPVGSPVNVMLDRHRDIGSIEVRDHGEGIPSDQQTRIFEPFYRGSYAQSNAKSGLGLGLSICKNIVERHSGRIWFRSSMGTGSTFIIELPLRRRLKGRTSALGA